MSREKHVLNVMEREDSGTSASRKARREGKVPAIMYGHGATPRRFLLDEKEWDIVSRHEVQIVELKSSSKETMNALVKDVQYDYLRGTTVHVDFLEVKMDEVIHAFVPIHSHGTPSGISKGGVLEYLMHEVEVSCTPLTLPESLDIDVSMLEIDDAIHVGDLVFPEGVTPIPEADHTVLHVILPRIQEEAAPEEGEAVEGEAVEGAEAAAEGAEGAEGETSEKETE